MKIPVKILTLEDCTYLVPNTKVCKFEEFSNSYYKATEYSDEREDILDEFDREFGDCEIEDLNEIQLYKDK